MTDRVGPMCHLLGRPTGIRTQALPITSRVRTSAWPLTRPKAACPLSASIRHSVRAAFMSSQVSDRDVEAVNALQSAAARCKMLSVSAALILLPISQAPSWPRPGRPRLPRMGAIWKAASESVEPAHACAACWPRPSQRPLRDNDGAAAVKPRRQLLRGAPVPLPARKW